MLGITFTITGKDGNGDAQTVEDLTGPNAGTVQFVQHKYLTEITSIVS